jgi:putative ABC transport system ATP-binding protein
MRFVSPLVVEKVTKKFRQGERAVMALQSISLEVQQGQFLAIMGASGSGKSTLLHLMAGLTYPDSGVVRVNGADLTGMNDKELTLFRRRHIGLIFQAFNLIPTLTATENIMLPLSLAANGSAEAGGKVDVLLKSLGLYDRRDHRPDALSGGEQQRVAIGRALATDPAVILADEPTGNLDSVNGRAVCQLLRDLSVNQGKTIVMVTHEPSVAAYAGEVAILRDGNLVQRFSTEGSNAQSLAVRYQEIMG